MRAAAARQLGGTALPRKVRRRTPRRWAECLDDLHDYASTAAPRRVARRSREDEWVNQRREHVADLERHATEAEAKLKRLYDAIETGSSM